MQWILNILIQKRNLLLFLFLLGIGIIFSSYRSSYHQTKLQRFGIIISGGVFKSINNSKSYLSLTESNQNLLAENSVLHQELLKYRQAENSISETTINSELNNYLVRSATVVKNSYAKARNILIIDKGTSDGILKDMSVVGPNGIIGIVKQTSDHFSSVISILYQDFRINAKIQGIGAFGSLSWEGHDPTRMVLSDVSIINTISVGDTIETGGMSAYFPKGIPIGTIIDFETPTTGGYYNIEVSLLNNLTDLEHVYIIENKKRSEFIDLQKKSEDGTR
jgi:rod shape-determining protein MreC